MWIKQTSTMQRKQSLTQGATPASGKVKRLACTLIPHPQRSEGCGKCQVHQFNSKAGSRGLYDEKRTPADYLILANELPHAEVTLCEVNFLLQAHSCSRTLQEKKYPKTSAQETQLVA
jgi:hypothetical protein